MAGIVETETIPLGILTSVLTDAFAGLLSPFSVNGIIPASAFISFTFSNAISGVFAVAESGLLAFPAVATVPLPESIIKSPLFLPACTLAVSSCGSILSRDILTEVRASSSVCGLALSTAASSSAAESWLLSSVVSDTSAGAAAVACGFTAVSSSAGSSTAFSFFSSGVSADSSSFILLRVSSKSPCPDAFPLEFFLDVA